MVRPVAAARHKAGGQLAFKSQLRLALTLLAVVGVVHAYSTEILNSASYSATRWRRLPTRR